jgi:DNA-binding Lrp family transcriptional regulator
MPELDSYDRKLLAAIQKDANLPQSELAEIVNLSTAAVNRRLKRLESEGVIQSYAAVLSPDALGYGLTLITAVKIVRTESVTQLHELRKALLNCPQVQQCYFVTGEWDLILVFLVQNMSEYSELTTRLLLNNPSVTHFTTAVTLSREKVGLQVPIVESTKKER